VSCSSELQGWIKKPAAERRAKDSNVFRRESNTRNQYVRARAFVLHSRSNRLLRYPRRLSFGWRMFRVITTVFYCLATTNVAAAEMDCCGQSAQSIAP
jgi:hypothetical protein